jgi:hypothetical protein
MNNNNERLLPVTLKAKNWKIGQCVANVSEEYANVIRANHDHIQKLKMKRAGVISAKEIKDSHWKTTIECINLMTAIRTLLWKMGLTEGDMKKAIHEVNAENKKRGYFE